MAKTFKTWFEQTYGLEYEEFKKFSDVAKENYKYLYGEYLQSSNEQEKTTKKDK